MSGWIPQVYYDLLARLIPGAAVLLGAYYLREGPVRGVNFILRRLSEHEGSIVVQVGVGLLAAYLLGLVIGELGELLAGRVLERRDTELEWDYARECLDEHTHAAHAAGRGEIDLGQDDLPSTEVMGEQLTLVDRYSGNRLLALKAERRLCLVLSFGLFMLVLGNLLAYTADLVVKRLVVEGLMIVALLLLWRRSTRLHERVVRQACLGWLMNVSRGAPSDPAR